MNFEQVFNSFFTPPSRTAHHSPVSHATTKHPHASPHKHRSALPPSSHDTQPAPLSHTAPAALESQVSPKPTAPPSLSHMTDTQALESLREVCMVLTKMYATHIPSLTEYSTKESSLLDLKKLLKGTFVFVHNEHSLDTPVGTELRAVLPCGIALAKLPHLSEQDPFYRIIRAWMSTIRDTVSSPLYDAFTTELCTYERTQLTHLQSLLEAETRPDKETIDTLSETLLREPTAAQYMREAPPTDLEALHKHVQEALSAYYADIDDTTHPDDQMESSANNEDTSFLMQE